MISIEQLMRRLARDAQSPGEMVQLSLAGQLPYDAAPAMPMALGGPPRPSAQPAPDATPTPSAGRMADMAAPEPVRVAQGPSIPGNALLDLSMGLHGGRPGGISGALGMLMAGPEQRAAQAQQMQRQQAEQNLTIEAIRKRHPDLDPNVAAVIAKTPKLMQEYLSIPDPMKGMTSDQKEYEQARKQGFTGSFMDYQTALKKAGATNVNTTVSTKGPNKVDELAAEEWHEWHTKGLRADALNQIDTLDGAIKKMRSIPGITGMKSGIVSMFGEGAQNYFTPEMKDVRQDVEQVAQRSLKAVLGAQFARVEGEMLLERAFNPWLAPEINARRAERLMAVAKDMAAAKDRYLAAFQANGFSMPTDPEKLIAPGLSELEKLKREWAAEDRRAGIPIGRGGRIPTQRHIDALLEKPEKADIFDEKFGEGAAALILRRGR